MKKIAIFTLFVIFLQNLFALTQEEYSSLIRSCNKGEKASCTALFPIDKAFCDNNKHLGTCYNTALRYIDGNGVKKDLATAMQYFEKSCKGGKTYVSALACYNIGTMYQNGVGVAIDYKTALDYYDRACKMRDKMACNNLGYMHANALGTKNDKEKAKDYYDKACKLGERLGCKNSEELGEIE